MSNKQTVQWFPGHMAKAKREIENSLKLVDAVIEIVDARMPESSRNPMLSEMLHGKPLMLIMNKIDLADTNATNAWISYYKKHDVLAMATNGKTGQGFDAFSKNTNDLLHNVIAVNEAKGMAGKPLRLMVVGIPNTGKSAFINRVSGKVRAKVADRPGVTRQNQWFKVSDNIELLDTPGVLWPKFEDEAVGNKLAFIGSVKENVYDVETLASRLASILANDYMSLLTQRYNLNAEDVEGLHGYDVLEQIGRKRGMLIRGGEVDMQRAAVHLLDEYRAGKLGKITLEHPKEFL